MTGSKQYVGRNPLRGSGLMPDVLLNRIDAGLILAALLTLLIIQSLWRPGLPAAADIPIHLYRTVEYGRAWSSGVIIPRWAPNLVYGYGYPLFVFAPPLPYLLGLAFHTLGLSFAAALKALIILIIPLYAIGMYLLVRDLLASVEAGLVAATAYAFAPFALREALLYGGNIPQFLAIGLFPWTLWALTRAVTARSWIWGVVSAIFYAGIVLSHLFHALIFTPVVGLFGLLFWLNSRKVWNSEWLTIPLGLLLSAFFWLPAFVERFYTRAQANAFLEKSPFFVRYPHWTELLAWIEPLDVRAANPYVPLSLGLVTLGLAVVGLVAGILSKYSAKKNEQLPNYQVAISPFGTTLFFGLIAATAIFLVLPLSQPVWETITLLQVAEFPWRMLGLANLGLAFLAGAALLLPPARLRRPLMVGCTLLLLFSVAPLLFPVTAFTRYGQPTITDQIQYERSSQSVGTTTLSEYLPRTVDQPPSTSPLVETYQANQIPERLDRDSLPAGARATLIEQTAVTHRYRLNSPTAFSLRLYQFDYPGWRAKLDGQPVAIRPQDKTGLILIDVPAGQHTLTVSFGETPLRLAAMFLTGLTVALLIIAPLIRYRQSEVRNQMPKVGSEPSHKSTPHLPVRSTLVVVGLPLIVVGAIWLKPLLRPVFTIESPPGQVLPAQYQAQIDFRPFGQAKNIRLIGYDLSRKVVPPGGYLQVTLYWQTDAAPLEANLQPFVHLDRLDDFTTIADATTYTPGDVTTESVLPTFHWDNARYIRDEHDLWLPPDAASMAYAVRVGLIDPDRAGRLLPLADGSGDTAHLTHINVPPAAEPIRLTRQLDIPFDNDSDLIRLTGFELDSLRPDRLNFRLAWQTGRPLQTDYTVFAQLLDHNQNLVASFDSPPLGGAYPTSTWLPEQTIIDPRHIPLEGVEPGEYDLIVGLYESETRARLTTPTGTDFVELTNISIKQP